MTKEPPHLIRRAAEVTYVTDQCDCACSEGVLLSRTGPIAPTRAWRLAEPLYTIPLEGTYRVACVPSGQGVAEGIAVLNDTAWEILAAYAPSHPAPPPLQAWYTQWGQAVVDPLLGEMVEVGLLYDPTAPYAPPQEVNHTLVAWLHVTDRCNLRCSYCYLPHHRVDMSWQTGRDILETLFRLAERHGYHKVKLKYAGGEAFLRFPFVLELQAYAQQLSRQSGIALSGIVLSNGTLLTAPLLRQLRAAALNLMISLDGIEQDHDCQRPYASGQGTFADVTRNIACALEQGVTPDISITVTARNAAGLPRLLDYILGQQLPFSLNFYRENDLSTSLHDLQLEEAHIIESMLAAFRVIEAQLPPHSLLASLIDRANLAVPHSRTCGVGHSYLVFNHQGAVAKCQMAMHDLITDLTDHDPLLRVREDQQGILNLPVTEKEGCTSCEWRYWCTGGCPLHTYRATGRYDVKSPNCRIYQALYPEAVRLEGLRLLRTAPYPASGGAESEMGRKPVSPSRFSG